jgi:hypothetical protein
MHSLYLYFWMIRCDAEADEPIWDWATFENVYA